MLGLPSFLPVIRSSNLINARVHNLLLARGDELTVRCTDKTPQIGLDPIDPADPVDLLQCPLS